MKARVFIVLRERFSWGYKLRKSLKNELFAYSMNQLRHLNEEDNIINKHEQ